ncbi:hypothetical protein [Anaerovorax sp. IOR16]|uniref:hypothetical protein n=1 Tax=Anaerovorax sp. IOR16 TaxID=2773458 RepID=UPI0019D2EEE9|nr:hypothetical protein [Anaerovorax sp. IOR16]
MEFLEVLIFFLIIYFAVSLAIRPLLHEEKKENISTYEDKALCLRDMHIISDAELEDVIEFLQEKQKKETERMQYQYYLDFLDELKENGYLSEEDYLIKLDKLKNHFEINEVEYQ